MSSAIKILHLKKEYPGIKAVDDLSFSVKKGFIHGLLGPNGAGKTTTLKMISGLLKAQSGNIEISGRVAYLPEVPPLYSDMLVEDYIVFVAKINKCYEAPAVLEALDKVKVLDLKDRLIGHLSKGQKQRVALASVLVLKPDILILDEPTVGLDPASIVEIRNLIRELREDGKHTILLSTHQLNEVEMICDEISIINKGKVILSGPLSEIWKNFQGQKVLIAEVGNWGGEVKSFFELLDFVSRVEESPLHSRFQIKFHLKNTEGNMNSDYRSKLSQYLVEKNCDLYAFKEEQLSLEEVFLQSTERKA